MSFNPERGERGDRKRRREREPTAFESLRIPPHSIEAEQAVLGGLMLSPDSLDKVADKLTDDDFYRKDHRLIWRAINELANKGMPCDAITLGDWFVANETAEMVGGASYLMELANSTPSAANIGAYGDIVREKSVLRMLIDAGTSITEDGFRPEGKSVQEVMELAEQRVFRIAESGARGKKDIVSVREAVGEAFRMLTERYEKRGQLTGLSTGFTDLDELTSGLQPSDLVIIAARPSMGKTAFALNLAEAAAMRGKKAVAVFSMEMSASQLAFRLISSLGRVHAQHLRNGDLAEEDWPRVTSAITMLSDAKIFIDDTPAMSPVEMRSRSRRLQREHGLGLIVIDYLQLMQVPGNSENRATEISEISRGLKALAKELNVPVIALSQLNRSLEQRADKRPMMSDLRESGAIEQDADVIMFIYRDEYYNKESPDKGLAEIIIGKQRNGPTDTVKLAFLGHYTKFENWAPDAYVGSFD
jgi:replicative DNA helicase